MSSDDKGAGLLSPATEATGFTIIVGTGGLLRMEVVWVINGLLMDDVTVLMAGRILPCPTLLMAGSSFPCGEILRIDFPEVGACVNMDCGITMIRGALGPDMVSSQF